MSSQETIKELTHEYGLPLDLAVSITFLSDHEIRDLAGWAMTLDMVDMEELAAVIDVRAERLTEVFGAAEK